MGRELTFGDSKDIKSYLIGEFRVKSRRVCVYTGLDFYFLSFEHVIWFTVLFFISGITKNTIDVLLERLVLMAVHVLRVGPVIGRARVMLRQTTCSSFRITRPSKYSDGCGGIIGGWVYGLAVHYSYFYYGG